MDLYRLRWRLARKVAPQSIMIDPTSGKPDGCYIVIRQDNVVTTIALDRLRMKSSVPRLRRDIRSMSDWAGFPSATTCMRFIGTAKR